LRPKKPGERVQTHRREALKLARLLRSGDLPLVYVPKGEAAAMRALCRAREEALHDLQAAQLRLQAFLRRQAMRSTGRAPRGPAHLRWLREGICPTPAPPSVFPEDVRAGNEPTERRQRLEQALRAQGQPGRLAPVGDALQALRGVHCTVAVTRGAALGDLTRFEPPRQLMHSLGLTPSAYATGERRRQGGMTKTGHTHARRARRAGAWGDRSPATGSRPLPRRLEKVPPPRQDLSGKAQVRRCTRYRQRIARGTPTHQVVVAIAREVVGVMGAMAHQVPVMPEPRRPMEGDGTAHGEGCHRASAEAQPRCGVALVSVKRRQETRVPSSRPAPDGPK
jgi:transposase